MAQKDFEFYFKSFRKKAQLIEEFERNNSLFSLALDDALTEESAKAWRALWFINQIVSPALAEELYKVYDRLIIRLENEDPSLQRELLKLLQKLDLAEKWESYLFNQSQKIWEKLSNIPSTRVQALYCMLKIAGIYPELKTEIALYNESSYLEDLSPGIKRQVHRLFQKL